MTMIITTRPELILEEHASLAERLLKPNDKLKDYMQFFMDDCWKKETPRALGMFYPVVPVDATEITLEQGTEMAKVLGHSLQDAVTYEITADMTRVMRAVYEQSEKQVTRIDAAELPGPCGWAWYDDGWVITDLHGDDYTVRAISWEKTTAWTTGTDAAPMGDAVLWPCVRITLWNHYDDDVNDGRLDRAMVDRIMHEAGPLTVSHTAVIPFSLEFSYHPDTTGAASSESFLGMVHILWMFLGMEITAEARPRIQNHYRKRARRSLKHHDVHVVVLRKIRHITEAEPGHREIDWTCRWVVQGHYRHVDLDPSCQPHRGIPDGMDKHCAACNRKLAWVRPYLKGPDGLPLKVSQTLHKLAR